MKKLWITAILAAALVAVVGGTMTAMAQDAAAPATGAAVAPASGSTTNTATGEPEKKKDAGLGFMTVVLSSGWLGVIIWIGLFGTSIAAAALAIDSIVTIKEVKIAPPELVSQVRDAMQQGDVLKAIKHCEERPTPLSNILTAGFQNVQEGFDVIQDVVGVSASLESEKLLQRVAYLNVCANIAPMLGLLGTVQGMIYAFGSLATMEAGAAQQQSLALNIAQALWTTAAGLVVAIPAISFYTYFKNRATKIILGMEGLTMDLIKTLRNVEVVSEEA